ELILQTENCFLSSYNPPRGQNKTEKSLPLIYQGSSTCFCLVKEVTDQSYLQCDTTSIIKE
ncbi:hypothetical protein ACJX0J_029488, partial [Zea mays]